MILGEKTVSLIKGKCFPPKSAGMSKTSKLLLKMFVTKRSLNLSRSRSCDVKVIDFASGSLRQDAFSCKIVCKSDNPSSRYSNGSQRDRQSNRQTDRQTDTPITNHNTVKTTFSKTFCGKMSDYGSLLLHDYSYPLYFFLQINVTNWQCSKS